MNIETVFLFIVSSFVACFAVFIVFRCFDCNTKFEGSPLEKIMVIIIGLIIGYFMVLWSDTSKNETSRKWNNGYCTECGQALEFTDYEYLKGDRGIYTYYCEDCGIVVQFDRNMKRGEN